MERPGETNSFNTWLQKHKVILMTWVAAKSPGTLGLEKAGVPWSSMLEISFKVLILAKELGKLAIKLFSRRA